MKTRIYALLLIPGALVALLILGMSLAQPAAHAQNGFDCDSVTGIPVAECEGLVALYNATDGPNWTQSTNWLQTDNPCGSWYGVSCSGGRVNWLSLHNNRLAGALPPAIGNFSGLTGLTLGSNQLTSIPPQIGNLTATTWLNLDKNQFTALPAEIGNLTSLTGLELSNNLLATLPATVDGWSKVQWLGLANNQLSSLPPQIGELEALTSLGLNGNQLTTLPSELSKLAALEILNLHDNPLTGEVPQFLSTLPALGKGGWHYESPFTFYNTGWCVPSSGPVPAWLATIEHEGTGIICGQDPGNISGQVILADTSQAAPGVQVILWRPLPAAEFHQEMGQPWLWVDHALTGEDGGYLFGGLGYGIGYRVHFMDPNGVYAPQYYDNRIFQELSTPVTLTLGMDRTDVDAVLRHPRPASAQVETGGEVTPNPDGTVTISQIRGDRSDITITLPVTCTGAVIPTDVNLKMTPPETIYPMTSVGGNNYQATIPADQVETAVLTVEYKCEGVDQEIPVGRIVLYDPSGIITDAETGQPVVGATVTLYNVPGWLPRTGPTDSRPKTCESNLSKPAGTAWSQPAPTALGVIANPDVVGMSPQISRQQTNEIGYYGWDVSEGCWYVTVTADGYTPLVSPMVGVPPEVLDLDLVLTPIREIYLPSVMR